MPDSHQERRNNGGVLVLSLGGSLLIPKEQGKPDRDFIARFAKLLVDERHRWSRPTGERGASGMR